MGFKAKDGKSFGNRQQMKAYDEREPKNGSEKVHHNEPDGDEGQDGSEQDIHEVVAEHGPADKIELHHDDAAGKHHVTSHHGEHTHKAVKAGREEAHEHAKAAAGVMPEMAEEKSAQPAMAGDGAIPGM